MKTTKEPSRMEGRASISFSGRRIDKVNAVITGCLFIAATVFAIVGLKLYDLILASDDFLLHGMAYSNQIIAGVFAK